MLSATNCCHGFHRLGVSSHLIPLSYLALTLDRYGFERANRLEQTMILMIESDTGTDDFLRDAPKRGPQ